ncbi:hypothetical protein BGZ83_005871 [Gryganskiella cystojenkinii]|nr:hypothetical protein BGZ83_005871 [Gryganskiella cystojenkinii]
MLSDPLRLSIFEIPLLLDLICSNFQSAQEIRPCLQVCRLWQSVFSTQVKRFVRFADLNESQTRAVLDRAHRVRHLEIDIEDAGLFLQGDDPDDGHPAAYCRNLQTLTCVDFGYFPQEIVDTNRRGMITGLSKHKIDPRTNALCLLERNAKLETLRVEYNRQYQYGTRHFTPAVLDALSYHQHLRRFVLRLNATVVSDLFIKDLLLCLPPQLQDLEIGRLANLGPSPLESQRDLYSDRGPIALKCFFFHQFGPTASARTAVVVPFLGKCPDLEDLSLCLSSFDGQELLAVLKETRPTLNKLNLANFCPHHIKSLVGLFPSLHSFSTGSRESCPHHYAGCQGPHSSPGRFDDSYWPMEDPGDNDDDAREDFTGLIPTILRRLGPTLVRLSILSSLNIMMPVTLAAKILEGCPNLKEFAAVPYSGKSFPLDGFLSSAWSCTGLESLELSVRPSVSLNTDKDDNKNEDTLIDLGLTKQIVLYLDQIHRFYCKIRTNTPLLRNLRLHWDLDWNCQPLAELNLEKALELLNRDKNGKLRPMDETLTLRDIQVFLGLSWQTEKEILTEHLKQEVLELPWIPLPGTGGEGVEYCQLYFPGFLDTRRTRQKSPLCYCGFACQCHYDNYTYAYEDFWDKVTLGPWYRDRKRLSKTHQTLHSRHSLKARRKPYR